MKRKAAIGYGHFKLLLVEGPAELESGESLDPSDLAATPAFKASIDDFNENYPGWSGAMNNYPPGAGEGRVYDVEWKCDNTESGVRTDRGVQLHSFAQLRRIFMTAKVTPDHDDFGAGDAASVSLLWSTALLTLNYETVGDSRWDRLLNAMMNEAVAELEAAEEAKIVWETIKIPNSCVGLVIGKQGATIKRLCEESGAYIQVQEDHESRGGVREVYICDDSGGMGSSAKAKELLTRIVKDEEKRQAERRRGGGGGNGRGRSGNRKNARGRGGGRGRPSAPGR